MLAFEGDAVIVVDCGGDVVQKMLQVGIALDRIALLILTHEHPDHVSGFPLFMERIWLAKRRRPIPVCGPAAALAQARRVFEAFDTSGWKGLPEIDWREVRLEEASPVWEDDEWRVTASPGKHGVPVIGVRIEHRTSGGTVTYSADTEPTDEIRRLAQGADILVHEATGDFSGHSSAAGAASIARQADAGNLVLVHLPPGLGEEDLREAREIFDAIEIGEDGGRYAI